VSGPFVDTDILIPLLTGDDPAKQEAAAALFGAWPPVSWPSRLPRA